LRQQVFEKEKRCQYYKEKFEKSKLNLEIKLGQAEAKAGIQLDEQLLKIQLLEG